MRHFQFDYLNNPQYGIRDLYYAVKKDTGGVNTALNKDYIFFYGKLRQYLLHFKFYNSSDSEKYSLAAYPFKYYKTIFKFRQNLSFSGRVDYCMSRYLVTIKDVWPEPRGIHKCVEEKLNYFSTQNYLMREAKYNDLSYKDRLKTTTSEEYDFLYNTEKRYLYKNVKKKIFTTLLLIYVTVDNIANDTLIEYPTWPRLKKSRGTVYPMHKFLNINLKSGLILSEKLKPNEDFINQKSKYKATPKIAIADSNSFGKGYWDYKYKLESQCLPNGHLTIHPKRPGHVQHVLNFIDYKYSSKFDQNIYNTSWDLQNNKYTDDFIDYIYPKFKLLQYMCKSRENFFEIIDDIDSNRYADEIDPKILSNSMLNENLKEKLVNFDNSLRYKQTFNQFFFKNNFNYFTNIDSCFLLKTKSYICKTTYMYNERMFDKMFMFKKYCRFMRIPEHSYNEIYQVKDPNVKYYPSKTIKPEDDPTVGDKYHLGEDGKPLRLISEDINLRKYDRVMSKTNRHYFKMSPLSNKDSITIRPKTPASMYYLNFDLVHELKYDLRYYLIKSLVNYHDTFGKYPLSIIDNNFDSVKIINEIYDFLNTFGNKSYSNFYYLPSKITSQLDEYNLKIGLNTHYLPLEKKFFSFIQAIEESVLTVKTPDPRIQLYLYLKSFICSDLFSGTNISISINDELLSIDDMLIKFKLLWLLNIERGLYNFIEHNKSFRLLFIPIQANLDDQFSNYLFNKNLNLKNNLYLDFTSINPFTQISLVGNYCQISNKMRAISCIDKNYVSSLLRIKKPQPIREDLPPPPVPLFFYTRLQDIDIVPTRGFGRDGYRPLKFQEGLITRKFIIRSVIINDNFITFWYFLTLIVLTFHIIIQLNFIVKDYFESKTTKFTKLQSSIFGITLYSCLFMYFIL